jgi:uncharacterized protein (DUF2225 family)
MKRIIAILISLFIIGPLYAITWISAKKTDPLTGEKIAVLEPGSWGSYIYQYRSKYDLVFFPLTDANWICFNPKNGYAAFNNDFETLPDGQKKALSAWLKENYDPSNAPKTHEEKLVWLERIYTQRKMDDEFWSRFYRLMAYVHRKNNEKRLLYVKKAMPLLKKKLDSNPEGFERIEVLFLLGEYHRRLAQTEQAKQYFGKVKTAKYKDKDGKEQVGHPYFLELVKQREKPDIDDSSDEPGTVDDKAAPPARPPAAKPTAFAFGDLRSFS